MVREKDRETRLQFDKHFAALSDGTRRGILRVLAKQDSSVGEITKHFSLAQPTISRHLGILRDARLVLDTRRGQQVIYSLEWRALEDVYPRFLKSLK